MYAALGQGYPPPEVDDFRDCEMDSHCAEGYRCNLGPGKCVAVAPPTWTPPPPKSATFPAKSGINFDIVVLGAIVVGAGAYLYGRGK